MHTDVGVKMDNCAILIYFIGEMTLKIMHKHVQIFDFSIPLFNVFGFRNSKFPRIITSQFNIAHIRRPVCPPLNEKLSTLVK